MDVWEYLTRLLSIDSAFQRELEMVTVRGKAAFDSSLSVKAPVFKYGSSDFWGPCIGGNSGVCQRGQGKCKARKTLH